MIEWDLHFVSVSEVRLDNLSLRTLLIVGQLQDSESRSREDTFRDKEGGVPCNRSRF